MVSLARARVAFARFWARLPIVGGLADCGWLDHWHALGQFVIEFIFATAPISLGALILYITDHSGAMSYRACLSAVTQGGELLVSCTATLGPVIFLVHKDPKGNRKFPGQAGHTVTAFVICAVCSCMFGLLRGNVGLNPTRWFMLSEVLYTLTIGLYYLAILYDVNITPDPPEVMKASEDAFVKRFTERVPSG